MPKFLLPSVRAAMRATALAALVALLPGAAAADLTVFAAASLKEALEETAAIWTTEHPDAPVRLVFAGSSALARQIEAGAPADLFLSANSDWMDRLDKAGQLRPDTRVDLLGNTLVLIGHAEDFASQTIDSDLPLAEVLGDERLAMALVDAVPAGIYGKAALERLGLWDAVAPSVAQTDNVRAALALVATGEAPLGIVYATDARAEPRVTVLGSFPPDSHPPITYPVAITADSTDPQAEAFLAFLSGPQAGAVFLDHGFSLVD